MNPAKKHATVIPAIAAESKEVVEPEQISNSLHFDLHNF
jgi:hypothetical protein